MRSQTTDSLRVVGGRATPALAAAVAAELDLALTAATSERFPDGEAHVTLHESVRGADVYVVQSTGPPGDRHVMELALLADACRRAGAERVTAVVPYFGYARQDRRIEPGDAVALPVVARLLAGAGIDQFLVVDPHAPALESVSPVPLESVSALRLLREAVLGDVAPDAVVVAPDLGAAKIAERFAAPLGLPTAYVRKSRLSGTQVEVGGVTGDVRGRAPVIVDDMISTGGTIVAAAEALVGAGCLGEIVVAATHGVLAGDAAAHLAGLPLRRLVLTDSLPSDLPASLPAQVVTLAPLLAGAIRRLHTGASQEDITHHG